MTARRMLVRARTLLLPRARALSTAVCVLAVLLPRAVAFAQVPDTARFRLDSLHVPVLRSAIVGERAPVSLSRVERAAIQDGRQTLGLEESLGRVPGLVVSNRYNFSLGSRIVIRGLGARAAFGVRGVRVLVDGIPLTMPDGQTNLNNLDLGSAGAIHVLRGPASSLYGNAAGGVIAVETEAAPAALSAEARVTAGDQGRDELTRFVKAQVKLAEASPGFDYIASIAHLDADGFRDHSQTRHTLLNGVARVRLGAATRGWIVLNAVDAPEAFSPGALPLDSARLRPSMAWPRNAQTLSGEATRQAQLGLRVERQSASARIDLSVYALRRTLENPLPFAYIDLARNAGGVRALYERLLPGSVHPVLTLGLDLEAQRDRRLEYANVGGQPDGEPRRNQDDDVSSAGPFAQLRIASGRFGVMLGVRYDLVNFETTDRRGVEPDQSGSRTLQAPSVMFGATMETRPAILFANVASAFQTPTTTELINAPPAPGEPCCPSGFNRDLEPQRALSVEAGVRAPSSARFRYEAALYAMRVRDALVQFQVPTVEGRDFFRNAGRTRHRGVELGAGVSLSPVTLDAAYTWTDVTFGDDASAATAFEGNRVPGIPPHRFFAGAGVRTGPVRVAAELQHHSRQYANDANDVTAPAFTLLDVRVEATASTRAIELTPFVGLNNVLGTRYYSSLTVNAAAARFFEPAPRFNVHFGVAVRTGGWRRR